MKVGAKWCKLERCPQVIDSKGENGGADGIRNWKACSPQLATAFKPSFYCSNVSRSTPSLNYLGANWVRPVDSQNPTHQSRKHRMSVLTALFLVLLSGCDLEPLTNKQIVEEVQFCESHGMRSSISYNGWRPSQIWAVTCLPKKEICDSTPTSTGGE